MKITITPNAEEGSTATPQPRVLGDDLAREFIRIIPPIEGTVEVQTVALPRATATERFLRHNSQVRFAFVVDRAHESFAAALAFSIREIKEVKGIVGTITLSATGFSGGAVSLSNCIITAVRVVDMSSSTVIQYSVEGGDFD
jgi:hypothetical protein